MGTQESVAEKEAGMKPEPNLAATIQAVMKIGQERKVVLDKMKAALESGNDSEALKLARLYVGLEATHEKSDRIN